MSREDLDALPFGLIGLDAMGIVRVYNAAEATYSGRSPDRVIGRSFFEEIAPCTNVRDFHGRFVGLVTGRLAPPVTFRFNFAFPERDVDVRIVMDSAGGYEVAVWVVVEKEELSLPGSE
jgi:photoactive yellow protein